MGTKGNSVVLLNGDDFLELFSGYKHCRLEARLGNFDLFYLYGPFSIQRIDPEICEGMKITDCLTVSARPFMDSYSA